MSESSGDTPEWLRRHTETPIKIFISSSDDDDDIPLVRRAAGAELGGTRGIDGGPGPSQPTAVTPLGKAEAPDAPLQSTQAPQDVVKASSQHAKKENTDQPPPKEDIAPLSPHLRATGQKPGQQKQESQTQAQLVPGGPSIAANLGGTVEAGKLPIMLPEKLNRNKVLLELPPAPTSAEHYHGAADLSGDSGAVGRLVVMGTGADGKGPTAAGTGSSNSGGMQLQVDLKGVMYNAWVLPLAATVLVLNIGPTEAKVESLFNDFIRLREAVDQYSVDADGGDAGLAYLLDGDDENYQVGVGGGDGDDASGSGAKAGKGKSRKRAPTDREDGGGVDKKAKTKTKAKAKNPPKAPATKANKKSAGAGGAAKKTPTKKKAVAEPKTADEGKKTGPRKATAAKKADEKKPTATDTKTKKTAAGHMGLGVKSSGVTKKTGTGASSGGKKQSTLTGLVAAAKPGGSNGK